MGLFSKEFKNVVEWEEWREDMIFWKWTNREIKKNSHLILKPGQDAIFLNNGKIEGVFQDDGEYDIESQIIPFLSTLKGFSFGFNSGMRAEVLFINTKEFVIKWGTKAPINIPTPQLPGGMPIRANGTLTMKLRNDDYTTLIDKVAGVKQEYFVDDVKIRITAVLDQLLMKWISKEGKDMFNLQANAFDISKGLQSDLDQQMMDIGITITSFNIMSFNYPEEVQKMLTKVASQSMVADVGKYQQVSMTDAMADGKLQGGSTAGDMAGMMMGMQMAGQMMNQMNQSMNPQGQQAPAGMPAAPAAGAENGTIPKFCPNCGQATNGAKFCGNCGQKLI